MMYVHNKWVRLGRRRCSFRWTLFLHYLSCVCARTCGARVGVPINENGGGRVRGVLVHVRAGPPRPAGRRANASWPRRRATGFPQPHHEWTAAARTIFKSDGGGGGATTPPPTSRSRRHSSFATRTVLTRTVDANRLVIRIIIITTTTTILFLVLFFGSLFSRNLSVTIRRSSVEYIITHIILSARSGGYEPVRHVLEIRTTQSAPRRSEQQGGPDQAPVAAVGGEGRRLLWRWEKRDSVWFLEAFISYIIII